MVVNLPKLHPGQKRIWNEIEEADKMFNIIRCSRQWGKSYIITSLLIYYSYMHPRYTLSDGTIKTCKNLFVSPTVSQVKIVFKQIVKMLKQFDKNIYVNQSDIYIRLSNGVELYFKGVDKPDNIRGIDVSYMFCDEAAFYKNGTWSDILSKMLTVAGRKAFLVSTPKGKHNEFYNMDMQGISGNKLYCSTYGTWEENPYANITLIKDAELSSPEHSFKQEYGAEYIDDGGEVFRNIERVSTVKQFHPFIKGMTYFAGVDFGRKNDSTVLTILNNRREVVYVLSQKGGEWTVMLDNIVDKLKEYNPITLAESNGIGDMPFQILRSKHSKVIEHITTQKSKKTIIEGLIKSINLQDIKLLDKKFYPAMFNELSSYQMIGDKYSAPEGLHDDHVMSLAIANYTFDKYKSSGDFIIDKYTNENRY